jgi:hypothetical protein
MPVPAGFYTVPPMGQFGAPRPVTGRRHAGLDQYAPEGTASGLEQAATILDKGSNLDPATGYGHWIRYLHDDGHELLEAHLLAPSPLQVGRRYAADTLVGRVGDTGNAIRVGPHVHVEVRTPRGTLIDPARYLASIQPVETPDLEEEEPMAKPFMIHTRTKAGTRWAVVSADLREFRPVTTQASANDLSRRVTGPSAEVTPAEFAEFEARAL